MATAQSSCELLSFVTGSAADEWSLLVTHFIFWNQGSVEKNKKQKRYNEMSVFESPRFLGLY